MTNTSTVPYCPRMLRKAHACHTRSHDTLHLRRTGMFSENCRVPERWKSEVLKMVIVEISHPPNSKKNI